MYAAPSVDTFEITNIRFDSAIVEIYISSYGTPTPEDEFSILVNGEETKLDFDRHNQIPVTDLDPQTTYTVTGSYEYYRSSNALVNDDPTLVNLIPLNFNTSQTPIEPPELNHFEATNIRHNSATIEYEFTNPSGSVSFERSYIQIGHTRVNVKGPSGSINFVSLKAGTDYYLSINIFYKSTENSA
ncbi:MAG: hypothetical protein DRP42_08050, partial [Tenericutes bacterium]